MTEENLSGLLNYSPVLVSRFSLNCLIPSQWLRARLALCIPHKKKTKLNPWMCGNIMDSK